MCHLLFERMPASAVATTARANTSSHRSSFFASGWSAVHHRHGADDHDDETQHHDEQDAQVWSHQPLASDSA
jgi:hypothetical protein